MSAAPPRLEDTLVTGYKRLASDAPDRLKDLELRTLDILFSSVFLILFSPIALVIALVMLVTSGRPVLYRGQRVGRGGHFFEMLKFRTLKPGAEERIGQYLGEELVRRTDVELTRIGRWLKASQLDEIPQLWNVLRGDMSFVGPRPIRPRFFTELAHDLPAYWQRLVVRPGLTGFAQVRRGYETSMAEKLAHDLEWIADRSVRLYLRTLVITAARVLRPVAQPPRLDWPAMCGICGIASSRGAVDPERLRRMSTTLYHRGPDSEGSHVDGPSGSRRGGSRSST